MQWVLLVTHNHSNICQTNKFEVVVFHKSLGLVVAELVVEIVILTVHVPNSLEDPTTAQVEETEEKS